MAIDILSTAPYPGCALSNFASHPFMLDGIYIASMEGFLQALKQPDRAKQYAMCRLVGKQAKLSGSKLHWQFKQKLYWQGKAYDRESAEYRDFIFNAYMEMMYQSTTFKQALCDTVEEELTHVIGSEDPKESVLTASEFCSILKKVREEMYVLLDALERHG